MVKGRDFRVCGVQAWAIDELVFWGWDLELEV
jgi:hypothetical protein